MLKLKICKNQTEKAFFKAVVVIATAVITTYSIGVDLDMEMQNHCRNLGGGVNGNQCYRDCNGNGIYDNDETLHPLSINSVDFENISCDELTCTNLLYAANVLNGNNVTVGRCYRDCNGNGSVDPLIDKMITRAGIIPNCTTCGVGEVEDNGNCYTDCNSNNSYESSVDKPRGTPCDVSCNAGEVNDGTSCYKDCDGSGNKTDPDVLSGNACTECGSNQFLNNGACYQDCNRNGRLDGATVDVLAGTDCPCRAGAIEHTDGLCYRDCDGNSAYTANIDVTPSTTACTACGTGQVLNNGTCYNDCNGDGSYQPATDLGLNQSCPLVCNAGEVNDGTSCYKDCDGNAQYSQGIDITPPTAACTACGANQVLNSGVCYRDCDGDNAYDSSKDVALTSICPIVCNTGEVTDGTSCYKDCDGSGSHTTPDITPSTAACTACGANQVLNNGVCYKDCNSTDSYEAGTDVALTGSCPVIPTCNVVGAYFDRAKNSTECVLDCLNSSGNTHSVAESTQATSCYFKCPNNAYVLKTAQSTCQKNCSDGSTVNVSQNCPTSSVGTAVVLDIGGVAPEVPGFNESNRAMNIHGELAFRSMYTIGRADRPDYICRYMDDNNKISNTIIYTQFFCPLLKDCPVGTTCSCRHSNGEAIPNTICDYALIDPLRNERGLSGGETTTINKQHIEEVNFEIVTITVPPH